VDETKQPWSSIPEPSDDVRSQHVAIEANPDSFTQPTDQYGAAQRGPHHQASDLHGVGADLEGGYDIPKSYASITRPEATLRELSELSETSDDQRQVNQPAEPVPVPEQLLIRRESRAILALLSVLTLLLLVYLRIDLLLTNTIPTGGDNGGHVWTADYLKRELLPNLRPVGWSNDWFEGLPVLNFYFPAPMWLIAFLSYVLPYSIAYKLVTVLGITSLPLIAYRSGTRADLSRVRAGFLGLATVPFLLLLHYEILGGNILSTMAGEFSFSISLALVMLYTGLLTRTLRTGLGRGRTALVLALAGLSHIVPTLLALAFTLAAFLVEQRRGQRSRQLRDVALVGGVGGALAGFWLVPFASNLSYTNSMDYERVRKFVKTLLPIFPGSATRWTLSLGITQSLVALFLAVIAVIIGLIQRDRFTLSWTITMIIAGIGFRLAPQGAMWNIRIIPLWWFCAYVLASQTLANVAELFEKRKERKLTKSAREQLLSRASVSLPQETATAIGAPIDSRPIDLGDSGATDQPDQPTNSSDRYVPQFKPKTYVHGQSAALMAFFTMMIAVGPAFELIPRAVPFPNYTKGTFGVNQLKDVTDIMKAPKPFGWANSNADGMQHKSGWKEYQSLLAALKPLPCGRAMWELASDDKDKTSRNDSTRYGSTMSLMLLPYFTKSCIQSSEGLYFESSATAPFHWLTKAYVTDKPANAQRRLPYPKLDLALGVDRMRALGIRYYMPSSEHAKTEAAKQPGLRPVAESKPYVIYEVVNNAIVEPLTEEPVVATGIGDGLETGWIDLGIAQWMSPKSFPSTLLASGPSQWQRANVEIKPISTLSKALPKRGSGVSLTSSPVTRALDRAVVSNVVVENLKVSFDVDRVGIPVLVRVSYFPNWVASGAKGPYRATPNFMIVIPTAKHVELNYGRDSADKIGLSLSGIGVIGLVLFAFFDRRRKRGLRAESLTIK
jgi:6-pyruvoyl-tetrahydropterin synthase related domain